jgi:capsular exopolysaccharide synthesis family protein
VLITSAQPGEGKTSVATSLALVQALAGQRVLLIDADTRQPSVHEVTGAAREPGLLDVLSGRATLEQALRPPNEIPFAILPAGAPTPNTPTLLASQRMDALLAELRPRFDLIVLDSPPVMAASDSRILARKLDAVALVVRWAATRRETVRHTLRQLEGDGALVGVLLTLVDARRHAQYSYGDSGAYTGALEKYYTR